MPRVAITVPVANEVVTTGKPFAVVGVVRTRGMPEPITIEKVTVRVGGGSIGEEAFPRRKATAGAKDLLPLSGASLVSVV